MTAALILAAGKGQRLGGDIPKGIRPLAGRPLYRYSLEAASACADVGVLVLVVPDGRLELIRADLEAQPLTKEIRLTTGGVIRQDSVLRGLAVLPEGTEWVAVHDAARPLATPRLFSAVIQLAQQHGGAIAAVRATDTLKRKPPGQHLKTLLREELWHAQTPQVFRVRELAPALQACAAAGKEVTDEAEAMEASGTDVALYENSESNLKISTQADWQAAQHLLGVSA